MPGSIFGDERHRRPEVEFVAEAEFHLVLVQPAAGAQGRAGEAGGIGQHATIDIGVRHGAETRVAIFAAHPPMVVDGIFDAAAHRPADREIRKEVRTVEEIAAVDAGVGASVADQGVARCIVAERDTTRGVDQGAVPRIAQAAADRALDVGGGRCGQGADAKGGRKTGLIERAGQVDTAFNTDHPLVDLIIVAEMCAANRTDWPPQKTL